MTQQTCRITIEPSGETIIATRGISLLKAVWGRNSDIDSLCGGKGICGKCKGRILKGKASPVTTEEREMLTPEEIKEGGCLLCRRYVTEDINLTIDRERPNSREYLPVKGEIKKITDVDPVVIKKAYHISNRENPDLESDLEKLLDTVQEDILFDPILFPLLPNLLSENNGCFTATVIENEITALESGDTSRKNFGIAFDIGTTSVAGYLVDLNDGRILDSQSAVNNQRRYGADVISYMTYSMENKDGLYTMKSLAVETMDDIIRRLLTDSDIQPIHIHLVTIVCNTVIAHLILGISPKGLFCPPLTPAFSKQVTGSVRLLGLSTLPETSRFMMLPRIGGYVGSDTVGVMLSTKIFEKKGNWVAVDIGTNGEVVLSTQNRLLTCSTAAGPAFEGALISRGMRAEPGAIHRVRFDDDDVKFDVIGGGRALGICGSGLIDLVSEMIRLSVLESNGRIIAPEEQRKNLPEKIRNRIGYERNSLCFILRDGDKPLAVTQKDISELQLGKGAVRAGIEVLMDEAGVTTLDGIFLAGAFGNNADPVSLKRIGLLPDIDLNRIYTVGNAAGMGAVMALASRKTLYTAFSLPEKTEHIELSLHPGFHQFFAKELRF